MEKWPSKVGYITKIAEFFSTALTAQTSNYVSWKQLTAQLIYNDFDERYTFGRSCASHALEETTKSMHEFSWWALQKVQSVTFHFLKFVHQFYPTKARKLNLQLDDFVFLWIILSSSFMFYLNKSKIISLSSLSSLSHKFSYWHFMVIHDVSLWEIISYQMNQSTN